MSITDIEAITKAQKAAIDSFLAISQIYLDSAERLSALNTSALREAVIDGAAAARAMASMASASDMQGLQAEMTPPMIDKAMAYTRSLQELAVKTRTELAQAMESGFSASNVQLPMANSWPEIIALFAKSAPQRQVVGAGKIAAVGARRA